MITQCQRGVEPRRKSRTLAFFIFHDVFASRQPHISMLRNDYTVPTRCRTEAEKSNHPPPPCDTKPCRALHQPISHPIKYLIIRAKITQNHSVCCHQAFHRIRSHAFESYYRSYTVTISGVNRITPDLTWSTFRKKFQQNFLAHDIDRGLVFSSAYHFPMRTLKEIASRAPRLCPRETS
jgi:hypothetical protein